MPAALPAPTLGLHGAYLHLHWAYVGLPGDSGPEPGGLWPESVGDLHGPTKMLKSLSGG